MIFFPVTDILFVNIYCIISAKRGKLAAMHLAYKNIAPLLALTLCLLSAQAPCKSNTFTSAAPYNWNAAALRSKSDAEIRRANKQEFALIYGGNSKGQVIPYPPSRDALGGLSRYAAVIKSIRHAYPVNLSIDVGNLLNTASAEHRARLTADYYNLMSFDAVAPGEGELFFGLPKFSDLQLRALPVVVSNTILSKDVGVHTSILLSRDGFQLFLLNIIGESVWAKNGIAYDDFDDDINKLKNILAKRTATTAMLRAAVVHGNMKDIEKIAAALPSLNIIIAGSLEEKFDTPRKIGSTIILSAGTENKFVGCVSLRFDGKKSVAYTGNKLYPVYQSIAPDPIVEDIVRLVSAKVSVNNDPDIYAAASVRGVIPFLSDRNGKTSGAFLKTIDISREYTLGANIDNCRKPILSTSNNRAAFIYGKPEEMNGKLYMVDLATMNGRTVASGRNVLDAAFSAPDDFLYYIEADIGSSTGAIYKTRTFMYGAVTVLEQDGSVRRDLSVSSNGATLLFCSNSGGLWHVYAVDSSAAAPPVKLTAEKANHRYPRMSPDGKFIAYLSDLNGFDGRMELWVFDRKRWKHRQITVSANVRDFCWKDNSQTIYFSSGINVTDINSIDILDKQAGFQKMTPTGNPKNWSETAPMFIRYRGAPKIVYTREYIDGNRQLYWFDTRNTTDRKIFTFGEWNEWTE